MRIAQITDLHIGEEGELPFDVDVRRNFCKVLEAVKHLQVDQMVISGDLCLREGDAEIYKWIKAQLAPLSIPYHIISGNHDNPELLAQLFELTTDLHDDALYFTRSFDQHTIIFLDTTTGHMPLVQREWLRQQLADLDREAIIFMHHPPLAGGVPHMDNHYPLQNREEVQAVLFDHPYPITIFCGHYHVEKTMQLENLTVYITPATYFQIDQFSEAFAVDHKRPGFRIIDLENGLLRHTVRYL